MELIKLLVVTTGLCCVLHTGGNLSKQTTDTVPKSAIKGNFNGKPGYAWIVPPQLTADKESCVNGDCTTYIHFSDPTIKPIKLSNCIGGIPTNLGDLNNDGKDEIGLLRDWFTSCWRAYEVYTIKQGIGRHAVAPFSTHCNQWDNHIKPIEKDRRKRGYVIIHYSDFENDEIVTKAKSVAIK